MRGPNEVVEVIRYVDKLGYDRKGLPAVPARGVHRGIQDPEELAKVVDLAAPVWEEDKT